MSKFVRRVRRCQAVLLVAAAASSVLAPMARAEESLADQKLRADMAKAQADTQKVVTDNQAAILKMFRETAGGGVGTASGAENSAEGLVLIHHAYAGAVARLADKVPAASSPIVVFGTTPPATGDWVAYQAAVKRLDENITQANTDWRAAEAFNPQAVGTAIAVVGLVASIADLFTVDTTYAGAGATAKNDQVDVQLARALALRRLTVDYAAYRPLTDTSTADALFETLRKGYEKAKANYNDGYLEALAGQGGKVDKLDPVVAKAGKNLETVIADFDALNKAIHTPVNGVLPAASLTRQAALVRGLASRPILYIVSHRAAVTTTTEKGFFKGWGRPPVWLTAAALFDYVLVTVTDATPGAISCITPRTKMASIIPDEIKPDINASNASAPKSNVSALACLPEVLT